MIEARVSKEPNTGCWLWEGYCSPSGYAQIGRNEMVHRLSYLEYKGEIPEGWHVHHLCETRCCVNPQHLEAISPEDHVRETLRINGKSYLWVNRARATHCGRGHEFTAENTHVTKDGRKRYCRACIKINNDKRNRSSKQTTPISTSPQFSPA